MLMMASIELLMAALCFLILAKAENKFHNSVFALFGMTSLVYAVAHFRADTAVLGLSAHIEHVVVWAAIVFKFIHVEAEARKGKTFCHKRGIECPLALEEARRKEKNQQSPIKRDVRRTIKT